MPQLNELIDYPMGILKTSFAIELGSHGIDTEWRHT